MAKFHPQSFNNFIACVLPFIAFICLSSSARTLENSTRTRHHTHHKLSFLMKDVLNVTKHPSSRAPSTTKPTSHLPFSKPLGFFPPSGGIPIPETYTTTTAPVIAFSPQTLDFSTIGMSFPVREALQELEFGVVTEISEELLETSRRNLKVVGKIEGFYVANSEDGGGHMVAMSLYFGTNELKNGLKLFGVYRRDVRESHLAVVGGIGKYVGANGYATLEKSVIDTKAKFGANYKLIEFNVYLSK